MDLKTRRIIFWAMLAVFFIMAPILVLYSAGWRINFDTFRVTKTGAIQLNIADKDAKVKIDNKLKKSRLIDNLVPRTYHVQVSKEKYQTWKKDLLVAPSQVTETKNVVLTPEIVLAKNLKSEVKDFAVSGNQFIWQEQSGSFFLTNVADLDSALNLDLLFQNLKEKQLDLPGRVPIIQIIPQKNTNHFKIKTAKAAYFLDIKKMKLELTDEIEPPLPPSLYSPDENKIATPTDEGVVIITNDQSIKFTINNDRLIKGISWYKDSDHLFVQYPDQLYFLELDDRSPLNFHLIAEGVKKYAYDPKNDRLYLLLNEELKYLDF